MQQLLLTFSLAFVAVTKTAQYSNEWRKKTNNLKIFNTIASAKEKIVLQTVLDLAKEKKKIETKDISVAINQKVREPIKFDDLLNLIKHLEEYGFIKKDIISVQNKPKLIWKI
jgi:hypothetical protein